MYIPTSRLLFPAGPCALHQKAISKYTNLDCKLKGLVTSLTTQTGTAEKLKNDLLQADLSLHGGIRSTKKILPLQLSEPTKYAIREHKRLLVELFSVSILNQIFIGCRFDDQIKDERFQIHSIVMDLECWERLIQF
jgi:hypothetical protein